MLGELAGGTAEPTQDPRREPPSDEEPPDREPEAHQPPDRESSAGPAGPATEASPFQVREEGLVWTCPVCESENPLEAQICLRCGTRFGSLFEEEHAAPRVDPGRATALSLFFPGLGHLAAGRRVDGVARMLIFGWLIGTLLVIVVSRAGRGLGPLLGLVALYMASAGAIYLLSAVDARRAAEGDEPVLSSRVLLYAVSALLLLTILLLFVTGPNLGS